MIIIIKNNNNYKTNYLRKVYELTRSWVLHSDISITEANYEVIHTSFFS